MGDRGWTKLSSIYIGTIIGAGFASGQEILQFFGIYGFKGIAGLLLATLLFSLVGGIILNRVYQKRITGYEDLLRPLLGRRVGGLIEIIIIAFLFVGYCVMLAGSGAIFKQQFQTSFNFGIYLMAGSTLLVFLFNIKGISLVNTIIVPLLLIGIISIGMMVILKEGLVFSNFNGVRVTKVGNWVTSAILYVSYNCISIVVIMSSLLPIIPSKKTAMKGGIMGGIGLGLLAIFILVPTLILYTDVYGVEIPMLKIADQVGPQGETIYTIILWLAMFTTAIASGFGFIRRISSVLKTNQRLFAILFCFVTLPMSKIGFSKLVSIFYPVFGYLGLFILITLAISSMTILKHRS